MDFYSIDRMGADSADVDSDTPKREQVHVTVGRHLILGCRLACGQRVAAGAFHVSLGHLLLALLLIWCVTTLEQRLAAGMASRFWIWGFANELAKLQLWLATVAVIAWMTKQPGAFMTLAMALVYALLPVWLLTGTLQFLTGTLNLDLSPTHASVMFYGLLAWHLAIFSGAWRLMPQGGSSQALGAVLLYCGALLAIAEFLPESSMFYADVEVPPGLDVETVYYRQSALLDQQLDALAPEDPSAVDLYLVGFGAYAPQDVFMREVDQVRDIFERDFGLDDHAVSLVNNSSTVWELPLANRYNLTAVLARLGEILDRDQDILVLFFTSHGNEDASVAVEFDPLAPNDIYADDIRSGLDASGIRWRVIVVSACFSGTFIDALKSPNTLIMTASAADKSSFGCSYENEWTYFGRAYFAEALVETRNFIDAFERARARVTEREEDEDKEPSDPQIWIGERIAEHLRVSRPLQNR